MNDLADVLARQANGVRSTPNVSDVLRRSTRLRRRARLERGSVVIGAVAVATTVITLIFVNSPSGTIAVGRAVAPPEVTVTGGLVIAGAKPDISYQFTPLDRVDPTANAGPHAVVVRRVGGTLVAGSAVVTYPVVATLLPPGEIRTDNTFGVSFSRMVAASPGGHVLVRGVGLTDAEMIAIGKATEVVNGRPVVHLTDSIKNFALVASGSTRPPVVHEARYGCDAVGENNTLGALCYTGLATSPGFEDALYSGGPQPGPLIDGHPSFVSIVGGGNATLAWEPEAGVIAYVGYSGRALDSTMIDALTRLAKRATLEPATQWTGATHHQSVTQDNTW